MMATSARHRFLEDYRTIRSAEGRGSQEAAYYRALPYQDLSGRNSAQWAIRGKSYRYFERNVLSQIERKTAANSMCWISGRGIAGCRIGFRSAEAPAGGARHF